MGRLIAGVTRGLFRDVEEVEDMLVDDSSEDSENELLALLGLCSGGAPQVGYNFDSNTLLNCMDKLTIEMGSLSIIV